MNRAASADVAVDPTRSMRYGVRGGKRVERVRSVPRERRGAARLWWCSTALAAVGLVVDVCGVGAPLAQILYVLAPVPGFWSPRSAHPVGAGLLASVFDAAALSTAPGD